MTGRAIHIAMLTHSYHPVIGGAERQIQNLVPYLAAEDVRLSVITRSVSGSPLTEEINGATVYRMPAPKPKPLASLSYTSSALLKLRSLAPQIIHAHGLFATTTTGVLAKQALGIPLVVKLMRGGVDGDVARLRDKFLGRQRLRYFQRHVDRFIVISQEITGELDAHGSSDDRYVYIPNGVDLSRFVPPDAAEKAEIRASLGLSADEVVVLFTGRLAPEKRLDLLLRSWAAVEDQLPHAKLMIVGTGPDATMLKRLARPSVIFTGPRDDVAPLLQAGDIFILPSATEGLSNALLEAMAAGLAPIATDVGGASDVIVSGESGILVAPGRENELTLSLCRLIKDQALRTRVSARARARIAERFDLRRTASDLRSLYEVVLDESSR